MKVYLAGGFDSDWRSKIKSHHELIDPSEKEKSGNWSVKSYSTWDKYAIQSCDVLFAYMERTNPSGIGLACELGYARGLGKFVILCIEPEHSYYKDSTLEFLTSFADNTFSNLELGIWFLNTLK